MHLFSLKLMCYEENAGRGLMRMGGDGGFDMMDLNQQLKLKIRQWMPTAGDFLTAVDGLILSRQDEVYRQDNIYPEPRLVVGLQGCKYTSSEKEEFWYGPNQCLILQSHYAGASRAPGVCPQNPFLSLSLSLDADLIALLLKETAGHQGFKTREGQTIAEVDTGILEAFLRLVRLLEKPSQIPFLAPLFIKEIHYRLLIGPLNGLLRQLQPASRPERVRLESLGIKKIFLN